MNFRQLFSAFLFLGFVNSISLAMENPAEKQFSIEVTNQSDVPVSLYLAREEGAALRHIRLYSKEAHLLNMFINGSLEIKGKTRFDSYYINYTLMPDGTIEVIGNYLKDIADKPSKPLFTLDPNKKLLVFIRPDKKISIKQGITERLP